MTEEYKDLLQDLRDNYKFIGMEEAIGYDEKTASEVATAFMNGDFNAVVQAQAKFVDAQKKSVLANAVKETLVNTINIARTKESTLNFIKSHLLEFFEYPLLYYCKEFISIINIEKSRLNYKPTFSGFVALFKIPLIFAIIIP